MFLKTRVIRFSLSIALFLCVFTCLQVRAEIATPDEMELVCQNWLRYVVSQKAGWAGSSSPQVVNVEALVENDTVLALCFSIAPRGYVVVPILKQLPPVKVYSEANGLEVNQRVGLPQLLREVLLERVRCFVKFYGSMETAQPSKDDTLFGSEHRREWDRFLAARDEFDAILDKGAHTPLVEVGPLLTTSWHQREPYNNFCPMGDGGAQPNRVRGNCNGPNHAVSQMATRRREHFVGFDGSLGR